MIASPELLAAADDAVALAVKMSSICQSDLASKGHHPWQNGGGIHSGRAPSRDATRCQLCFRIHTVLAKATKKQCKGKTIQTCILHESRHQAILIPGTNLCDIPTGNVTTGLKTKTPLWKCWCRDGQGGIRVSNHATPRVSIK